MHDFESLSCVEYLKNVRYVSSRAGDTIICHYFGSSKTGSSEITENEISTKASRFVLISIG